MEEHTSMFTGGETIGYISPRIISFSSNSAAGSTPNDSTVYYAGASQYGFLTTTGAGGFIMPSNGILRRAHMYLYSGTTTGTNEAWDVVIRNDTKTTDYTFASVSAATILRRWINNDLNIPVSQGDEIFFKTTTPAWATNPDGVRYNGFVWIEI